MTGNASDRAGINVLNSHLVVKCNTIQGTAATQGAIGTYGILGATTGTFATAQSRFICNQVNQTHTGVFFEGANAVDLQGTAFDQHDIGLLMTANAIIGDQFHHGNTWTGNTTSGDAAQTGLSVIGERSSDQGLFQTANSSV